MDLKNKVAIFGNVEKKLGHIFFYSLSEQLITKEKLEENFAKSGLDMDLFPHTIRPVDAFRRATTECETYGVPYGDCFVNYLIREVACDRDLVLRQVVEEVVDSKKKRLSFTPDVAKLILNRSSEQLIIEYNQLFQPDPLNPEAVLELISRAKLLYNQYLTHYTSRAVRNVVIQVLHGMKPTVIRPSGGVYFVQDQYSDDLDKLVQFIRLLEGQSEAWTIPLVDSEDMRAMITVKFREQVRSSLMQLSETLKKENVSSYEITQSLSRAKETLDAVREYEQALKTSMEDLELECEIIQKQMLVLLEKKVA
ncbi:MAG: hypothetical protein HPY90_11775 [Syntrophothermus sp.]|uniref:DUF6744 family protein n=1 Tax=Syntrophothermus sp. TaxID=2736299 RepID=UPI00257A4D94|nr:DUF6744 family protein [Syntrophothermus sp.]NSW83926.1 hypothetical protein [Syntrophothermus sp.]